MHQMLVHYVAEAKFRRSRRTSLFDHVTEVDIARVLNDVRSRYTGQSGNPPAELAGIRLLWPQRYGQQLCARPGDIGPSSFFSKRISANGFQGTNTVAFLFNAFP